MRLRTETGSVFEIDEQRMVCKRVPFIGQKELRKDGEEVPFFGFLEPPEIGKTASMIVKVADDDMPGFKKYTCRTTSIVTAIEKD
jgi:hypothetical protein